MSNASKMHGESPARSEEIQVADSQYNPTVTVSSTVSFHAPVNEAPKSKAPAGTVVAAQRTGLDMSRRDSHSGQLRINWLRLQMLCDLLSSDIPYGGPLAGEDKFALQSHSVHHQHQPLCAQ
jgi:hypothetical protein